ncbi:MAG TPA: hypothetical protein ENI87_09920 [bacterium]|nr:hypothetical protein [bacterium]
MHRSSALLLTALSALPLSGCCSLARLFCGPDRSPWVSIDFRTPERAVRTFLEALRRDDPEVVYRALSRGFRSANRLDGAIAKVAWDRIREHYPFLHVAGYAEVPPPRRRDPDHADVQIEVEGTPVRIELVRESYWEVRYSRPGTGPEQPFGPPGRWGAPLATLAETVRVENTTTEFSPDRSRVVIAPLEFQHQMIDEVPLELIESAGVYREWKIAALRQLTR